MKSVRFAVSPMLCCLVLSAGLAAQERAPLRIVAPASGTEVHPGQTIEIKVEADAGVTDLAIAAWDPLGFSQQTTAPNIFVLKIPETTPIAQYEVRVVGSDSKKQLVSSYPIDVDVEPDGDPVELRSEPEALYFEKGDNKPVNGRIIGSTPRIIGKFESGRILDVTNSTRTHCRSLNPSVAAVEKVGNCIIDPVGPGRTSIVVETPKAKLYVYTQVPGEDGHVPPRNDPPETLDAKPCPFKRPSSSAPCVVPPPEGQRPPR